MRGIAGRASFDRGELGNVPRSVAAPTETQESGRVLVARSRRNQSRSNADMIASLRAGSLTAEQHNDLLTHIKPGIGGLEERWD